MNESSNIWGEVKREWEWERGFQLYEYYFFFLLSHINYILAKIQNTIAEATMKDINIH